MKMKSPTGSKTAGFNGHEYEADKSGIFDIASTDVEVAKFHGFKSADEDDPAPTTVDPEKASRKDLIAFLKGKIEGRAMLKTTDELRSAARMVMEEEEYAASRQGAGDGSDDKTKANTEDGTAKG